MYIPLLDPHTPRVLQRVAVDARPIDQPQRVGLHVPPRRGVVVPHPVLVQAGFGLEPLAGEAQRGVGAGGCVHATEGEVGGIPHLHPRIVCRKDGPPNVVGADKVQRAVLDHADDHRVRPDVFADQRAGAGRRIVVVLRDPVAKRVIHRMDRLSRLRQMADQLLAKGILGILRLGHPAKANMWPAAS